MKITLTYEAIALFSMNCGAILPRDGWYAAGCEEKGPRVFTHPCIDKAFVGTVGDIDLRVPPVDDETETSTVRSSRLDREADLAAWKAPPGKEVEAAEKVMDVAATRCNGDPS